MAFFGSAPKKSADPTFTPPSTKQSNPLFEEVPPTTSNPLFGSTPATSSGPSFGEPPSKTSGPLFGQKDQERVLIDFEGLADSGSTTMIPDGYAGLNWDNGYAIDDARYVNSGYGNVVQSGTASTFNGNALPLSFSLLEEGTFDLSEGYFAAAWHNGLQLTVTALRDGDVVGSAELTLDPDPVKVDFLQGTAINSVEATFTGDFNDIDAVQMASMGGISAGMVGGGSHFTMDDLVLLTGGSQPELASGFPFFG